MTKPPETDTTLAGVRQAGIAAALVLAAFILRSPGFARSVLDWDESLYFLIAAQWRAGHLPYTTIWDNKPIGIYAIFAAAQCLFGPSVAAIRIVASLFAAIGAFTVFKITHALATPHQASAPGAALFAGFAYVIGSLSNDGLAANTELFMASFTALAVLAALAPGRAVTWAFCTGLALGAAFMVKYVALFESPAVLFLLLCRRPRAQWPGSFAAAAAGGAVPLALTILIYWHAGALAPWWRYSIAANVRRLAMAVPPGTVEYIVRLEAMRWGSLFAAALLVVGIAFRRVMSCARGRQVRPLDPVFIALWLAGGLAGAAAAKSFYDHYFLQMLPALCVASGWLLAQVRQRGALPALLIALALAPPAVAACSALREALRPVLVFRHGYPALQPDQPARIAAILNPQLHAMPGARIYVFDSQPIIYALTSQTPPTPYVLPSVLTGTSLAQVAGLDPVAEVKRILAQHPAFIIRRNPPPDPRTSNPAVYALLDLDLENNYTPWYHGDGAAIYRLKPQNPAPSSKPGLSAR